MRKFSTEPWVACVTATSPGTPQLPPWSHGGEPADFEIALAITPPISKKVPEVAAAPMRKNRASCPLGDAIPQRRIRTKTAAGPGRPDQTPSLADIVSPKSSNFGKQHGSPRIATASRGRASRVIRNAAAARGELRGCLSLGVRFFWRRHALACRWWGAAVLRHDGDERTAVTVELAAPNPRDARKCGKGDRAKARHLG